MILRDDMLELSRRMSPQRTSISRIAGAYFDEFNEIDGTFNTHFLKLSPSDKKKNLNLAKQLLLAETNQQLKDYSLSRKKSSKDSLLQLLDGIISNELKNDALLEIFYEQVASAYHPEYPWACFLLFGQYDVPSKGHDKEWMEGSEEVYTYLLCHISPQDNTFEPSEPEFGFLYPAFRERTTSMEHINIFEILPECPHQELVERLLRSSDN